MPHTEQLSVARAAELLKESRWTTQRRIRSGELPASRVGNTYVIAAADIDRLIADRAVTS